MRVMFIRFILITSVSYKNMALFGLRKITGIQVDDKMKIRPAFCRIKELYVKSIGKDIRATV